MNRTLPPLIGFLVVSAIYLYAYPQANVLYAGVVLLHAVGGVVAAAMLLFWLARSWRRGEALVCAGIVLLFLGAIPGLALIYTGALRSQWTLVYIHIGLRRWPPRLHRCWSSHSLGVGVGRRYERHGPASCMYSGRIRNGAATQPAGCVARSSRQF